MRDALLLEVRHSFRTLSKYPSFTAVVVLTLAIGIGANTAMFTVLDSVLLRPLPFRDSAELLSIWTNSSGERGNTAYPDFREISEGNRSFKAVAAYTRRMVNIGGQQEPERLRALFVSPAFLSLLGVQPTLGRDFVSKEGEWGTAPIAIISDGLWRRSFGADSKIIGRDMNINGRPHTIVGVLPQNFWFMDVADELVIPLTVSPGSNNRGNHFLNVVARLLPGVSREAAAADLARVSDSIVKKTQANKGIGFGLGLLQQDLVGNVRTAVLVLMGAVGFVLLIACANLASLVLARAVARQKETAIRTALGATPKRLLRQFLTESFLLSSLGGTLGVFCAYFITGLLRSVNTSTLPRAAQVHINPEVLLFTLAVTLLTVIAFGIIPVWHTAGGSLNKTLKGFGQGPSEGNRMYGFRAGLVIGEVAVALILLAGAGLMIKSLHMLRAVNSGFSDQNVLIFDVTLPRDKYIDPQLIQDYPFPGATSKANVFLQQAVEGINQIPGVVAVGGTSNLPVSGISWDKVVTFYDRPLPSSVERLPPIEYRPVVGDYFRALGIRLLQGRAFTAHDNLDSQLVAIVNQALVRRYMDGENPLGKQLSVNPPITLLPPSAAQGDYPKEQQKFTIVGVVGDARYSTLRQPAGPMVYVPYAQNAEGTLDMWFAVHTGRDPLPVVPAVRRAIADIDKDLPLGSMARMEDIVSDQIGRPRAEMFLLSVFGGLALLLAGIGVYGVMSYSVAQRTHEIGIRMALGARLVDVMRMVLSQGSILISFGMLLGVSGAIVLTRVMKSMIYGIGISDPQVLITTSIMLVLTALVAVYFPAKRATQVDPQSAIRNE